MDEIVDSNGNETVKKLLEILKQLNGESQPVPSRGGWMKRLADLREDAPRGE